MIYEEINSILYRYDGEQVRIEPWGPNAFRVRSTRCPEMPSEAWALEQSPPTVDVSSKISIVGDGSGTVTNGKAKAVITKRGKITIFNHCDDVVLEEYARNRRDLLDANCSALEVEAREFKPLVGGNYHLTMRFESLREDEQIYGMGQYQQPHLDLKGLDLELAHRNSQASVPFALSSLGYGILWNNPAIGRVVFGKNTTTFEAYSTKVLDYWVVVGDTPAEIVERHASVTGTPPMMPDYGLGFWQCKLRYETQEELLQVAREYRRRDLPIDLIVVDFFHWPMQGEWKFDKKFWPDPDAMVEELKSMGIELMVSIWPTVDQRSENFAEMMELGLLVRSERGVRTNFEFEGQTVYFDPTNPDARRYVWNKAKDHYYSKGIRTFWLDQAEPEYSVYDFDNYRYFLGPNLEVGNVYPRDYARTFFDGMFSRVTLPLTKRSRHARGVAGLQREPVKSAHYPAPRSQRETSNKRNASPQLETPAENMDMDILDESMNGSCDNEHGETDSYRAVAALPQEQPEVAEVMTLSDMNAGIAPAEERINDPVNWVVPSASEETGADGQVGNLSCSHDGNILDEYMAGATFMDQLAVSVLEAVEMLYMEKKLPEQLGDFDLLHWNANSIIAKAGGWEHPVLLHLHLSRLHLLTPLIHMRTLAAAASSRALSMPVETSKVDKARFYISQWVIRDQYKARLSLIHAGAILWHVRRYSVNNFLEPFSIFAATLVVWSYSTMMTFLKKNKRTGQEQANDRSTSPYISNDRAPTGASPLEAIGDTPLAETEEEPEPVFLHLDRPCDDEMVQTYVRLGHKMAGHMSKVGDICQVGAPRRILREGIRMLMGGAEQPLQSETSKQRESLMVDGQASYAWGIEQPYVELLDSLVRSSAD
ncbi:glycosyl hydrolase family 31 [Colletotrichum karsti]|uniref:Glycosyl hydrolase family 31 n=1 Tax=Colletotrichum karsti TaxID=1095194 RepID=A0A9P6I6H4_9PEZI|nr:glycosyl hydrolase family 31 [Colletotrichum karsti]KAF9878183.1 glycosyl hydrolase family 31 [Colletotrichum karsti]